MKKEKKQQQQQLFGPEIIYSYRNIKNKSAGPGQQNVLHFVSLTNGFIMLDAKLWNSILHLNNDSFTFPLIIGAFEKRALAFWPAFPQRIPKKDTPPLQPHPQGREGRFWIMAKKEVHRRWLLYFCQDVSCARYGNGVRSDRWRLCKLHRLWAKVLWFCLTFRDCSPKETNETTPAASTTKCLDYNTCHTMANIEYCHIMFYLNSTYWKSANQQ